MTVLGVFFTRGVSLRQWVESGLFDREVLIYRRHIRDRVFDEIVWFTYGDDDDAVGFELQAQGLLPTQVRVVPRPAWLSALGRGASLAYAFLMPLLLRQELRRCDVFKTNQMDGALAGVAVSFWLRRPLYVRTGYTLSRVVDRVHARNLLRRGFAWLSEAIAFRGSAAASVSSRYDRDYVVRRYGLVQRAPAVIGNYIDVAAFAPVATIARRERMIFVGRLSPEKNLEAAIAASVKTGLGLDIVGDGPERAKLQVMAQKLAADVNWLGILPNDRLPMLLAEYRYFFLPSLWEGMPKALLEAMAAGMVCIGNDTTGINEVIEDGVTGYLSAGPCTDDLARAIGRAVATDNAGVSAAARSYVCANFSLDTVAQRERDIFARLTTEAARVRA